MEEAGSRDEKNAEKDEFLGVANLFSEEEEKATGDKDGGKEVGAEAEKKKESATEIGAGWADEVGFGVLGGGWSRRRGRADRRRRGRGGGGYLNRGWRGR